MMIRDVVMGMKLVRFNHAEFQGKHGFNVVQACRPVLSELEDEGFVVVGDEEITLTDQGVLYGDYVGRSLEGAPRGYAGAVSKS
jgi:oxygen-independent coproporphyrinogen-3 oxidase